MNKSIMYITVRISLYPSIHSVWIQLLGGPSMILDDQHHALGLTLVWCSTERSHCCMMTQLCLGPQSCWIDNLLLYFDQWSTDFHWDWVSRLFQLLAILSIPIRPLLPCDMGHFVQQCSLSTCNSLPLQSSWLLWAERTSSYTFSGYESPNHHSQAVHMRESILLSITSLHSGHSSPTRLPIMSRHVWWINIKFWEEKVSNGCCLLLGLGVEHNTNYKHFNKRT